MLPGAVSNVNSNDVRIFGYGVGPRANGKELKTISGQLGSVAMQPDYTKLNNMNNEILHFLTTEPAAAVN